MKYTNEEYENIRKWIFSKKDAIKAGHQGMPIERILGDDLEYQMGRLKITILSANYFSCQGNADTMTVFAIKLNGGRNRDDFGSFAGFKIICSDYSCGGYLQNYRRVN
jgi:hypothetical protein